MPVIDSKQGRETGRRVNVLLTTGRITQGFRDALFEAADEAGLSPGDFALLAAARALMVDGRYQFPGVFRPGDNDHDNDNHGQKARRRA